MKKRRKLNVSPETAEKISAQIAIHPQQTQREIAEYLHISVPTVRAAIRQYHLPYLPKGKHCVDWERRSENYRAIVTVNLAARAAGLSYGTYVSQEGQKHGKI